MQPKLLIYIPTYNRPQSLARQLSKIVPAIHKYPDSVRVIVCDNGSSVENESVMQLARQSGVTVFENQINIGANANIAMGFALCKASEYLWILSDDDQILDGAVDYILGHIGSGDMCCITGDAVESVGPYAWADGWQPIMNMGMGLISNGIYHGALVGPFAQFAYLYHNSSFPHLAVSCAAVRDAGVVTLQRLRRGSIFSDAERLEEEPGDYRLSNVGMPLLLPLMPRAEARAFAAKWISAHGLQFFRNRNHYPEVYFQSKASLLRYGGLKSRAYLLAMAALHMVRNFARYFHVLFK